MRANLHTHSHFCDGQEAPRAYVDRARDLGFAVLGFSGHGPVDFGAGPVETGWNMLPGRLAEYKAHIRHLAEATQTTGGPRVLLGVEMDCLGGQPVPDQGNFAGGGWDFSLGAVHYLVPEDDQAPFTVDGPWAELEAGLQRVFAGNAQALVRAYWRQMRRLAEEGQFTFLAHLDLVVKHNRRHPFFDEDSDWYRREVLEVLDVCRQRDLVVEVNTGGVTRGYTVHPYPALPWLKQMRAWKIRSTLHSDAHHPDHLSSHRALGAEHLAAAGYKEISVWTPEGWVETGIEV